MINVASPTQDPDIKLLRDSIAKLEAQIAGMQAGVLVDSSRGVRRLIRNNAVS